MVTREEIHEFVVRHLQPNLDLLGLQPTDITVDTDLFSVGLVDSLGFVQMLSAIESQFGMELNLEDINPEDLYTIKGLATYVSKQQQ